MRLKVPLGKEEFQSMKFSPYQATLIRQGNDGGAHWADNKNGGPRASPQVALTRFGEKSVSPTIVLV